MRIRQAATPKANFLENAVKTESAGYPFHEVGWIREWDVVEGGHVSTLGRPCQEDRGRRAANALAGLILLRYGEGEGSFTDGEEACDDADARVSAEAGERPSDEPAGCVAPSSSPRTSR